MVQKDTKTWSGRIWSIGNLKAKVCDCGKTLDVVMEYVPQWGAAEEEVFVMVCSDTAEYRVPVKIE